MMKSRVFPGELALAHASTFSIELTTTPIFCEGTLASVLQIINLRFHRSFAFDKALLQDAPEVEGTAETAITTTTCPHYEGYHRNSLFKTAKPSCL